VLWIDGGGELNAVECQHSVDKSEHGSASSHDAPIGQVAGRHSGVKPGIVVDLALSEQLLQWIFAFHLHQTVLRSPRRHLHLILCDQRTLSAHLGVSNAADLFVIERHGRWQSILILRVSVFDRRAVFVALTVRHIRRKRAGVDILDGRRVSRAVTGVEETQLVLLFLLRK